MPKGKQIGGNSTKARKRVVEDHYSTDNMESVWVFDRLDTAGEYAFDLNRKDFKHAEVLKKIIEYSNMKWIDIKLQTHDRNKSKHHFLSTSRISRSGMSRVEAKLDIAEYDQIFSFAFQNRLRVIGIRNDEKFHVMWYDPDHAFCPSSK